MYCTIARKEPELVLFSSGFCPQQPPLHLTLGRSDLDLTLQLGVALLHVSQAHLGEHWTTDWTPYCTTGPCGEGRLILREVLVSSAAELGCRLARSAVLSASGAFGAVVRETKRLLPNRFLFVESSMVSLSCSHDKWGGGLKGFGKLLGLVAGRGITTEATYSRFTVFLLTHKSRQMSPDPPFALLSTT